jgi:chemotaxis protein CheD
MRLEAPLRTAAQQGGVFLSPGTLYCAPTSTVVTTILGSCVAVCLWDSHLRLGGMNHYLQPRRANDAHSPRFGDVAIDQLLEGMIRLGCRLASLRAKIFGGAAVLPFGASAETVGDQNVRMALARLRDHAIPLLARRTGGRTGMLIKLYTETGEVLGRRLADTHVAEVHGMWEPGAPFRD